jgi:adenine C2-methylase RlmN of 23S rRNA A2503 and tRNA A37
MIAVNRIINELGIGARRITISTVGIVPIIRKITSHSPQRTTIPTTVQAAAAITTRKRPQQQQTHAQNETIDVNNHDPTLDNIVLPQFRLAVSLHCATDEERTALLPANARNGGLTALMEALREYCDVTGRRITIEWALIAGQNDNVYTAQQLGRLLVRHPQYPLRPDLVHVNVIPLNPTALFEGQPSRAVSVNAFCHTLIHEFGISCTPRVRRGIDIDAGCGQLTTKYQQSQREAGVEKNDSTIIGNGNVQSRVSLRDFIPQTPVIGVYDEDEDDDDDDDVR